MRTCHFCQAKCIPDSRRSDARYCSVRCRVAAHRSNGPRLELFDLGTVYFPSRSTRSQRNYCHEKTCPECGNPFVGKSAQRYCSKRCGILVNNRKRTKGTDLVPYTGQRRTAPPTPTTIVRGKWWCAGTCRNCGSGFVSPHREVTCSERCRQAFYRSRRAHIPMRDRTRKAVYERDHLICQICLEATDPLADPSSDWFPSLDHIVPRSRGGSDDIGNLRTAHRWCNSVRGDESYYTEADLRVA